MDDFDFDVLTGPSGPAPKPGRERKPDAPEKQAEPDDPAPDGLGA